MVAVSWYVISLRVALDDGTGIDELLNFFLLQFVCADAVVVWRACVLWPGNIVAKILPLALLLASFGAVITTLLVFTAH